MKTVWSVVKGNSKALAMLQDQGESSESIDTFVSDRFTVNAGSSGVDGVGCGCFDIGSDCHQSRNT